MRTVQARFAVGDAGPGARLQAYGPDEGGSLDPANPIDHGAVCVHRQWPRGWGETAWACGPWCGPESGSRWGAVGWVQQAWMEEIGELAVSVGAYEYGVYEAGGKVFDLVGTESAMSSPGSFFVNARPPRQRSVGLSVAENQVTMNVTWHEE